MSTITYRASVTKSAIEQVRLDGKLVGYIRQDSYGYYYEPLGKGARGASLGSVRAVHRSLETDDEA